MLLVDSKENKGLNDDEKDVEQEARNEVSSSVVEPHEVEQILEKLEPEEQDIITTMFSGPLPPPEILQGYAESYPDAPERIFGWVEQQQSHRQSLEREYLKKDFNYRTLGIIGGLILSSLFIICGFILILKDKEAAGFVVMAPVIITVGSVLITQRRSKADEESKEKDNYE